VLVIRELCKGGYRTPTLTSCVTCLTKEMINAARFQLILGMCALKAAHTFFLCDGAGASDGDSDGDGDGDG
jgi:hypothetical protein